MDGQNLDIRFGESLFPADRGGQQRATNQNFSIEKQRAKRPINFHLYYETTLRIPPRGYAATYTTTQFIREIELLPNLYLDGTLLKDSSNFSAFININGDTTEVWTLSRTVTQGKQIERNYEFFLTDGKREILLIPTNSNKNGENSRSLPASGL